MRPCVAAYVGTDKQLLWMLLTKLAWVFDEPDVAQINGKHALLRGESVSSKGLEIRAPACLMQWHLRLGDQVQVDATVRGSNAQLTVVMDNGQSCTAQAR
jgi:hypothetical protein